MQEAKLQTAGETASKKSLLAGAIEILDRGGKSAWRDGVKKYTAEILTNLPDEIPTRKKDLEKLMLNGAREWREYSEGGCSLIYNGDICARLCSPSEQRRKKSGALPPNSRENWIDVQARALRQAASAILDAITYYTR